MKIAVLGSSSSGNGYILDSGDEQLVIEVGVPMKECMRALDYKIDGIQGVVISHNHGDHCKYENQYEQYVLPIWKPVEEIETNKKFGNFRVIAFELPHDGTENRGLFIYSCEERIVYMTDMEYTAYTFKNAKPSIMLIECNYAEKYLNEEEVKFNHEVKGHCSLETCKGIIKANDNDKLKQIILIHPSKDALDKNEALSEIKAITDKPVCFAEKGMVIEI